MKTQEEMIKAQELRINNLISDRNGFKMKVVSIHNDGTIYCDFDGNEGDVWEFDDKNPCYGIPLTEEILLKCGFTSLDENVFIHKELRYSDTFKIREDGYIAFVSREVYITKIKYLHQLQNLFFSITGEELEFKQ